MNLLKVLGTISSMTLLSRILGFVRDTVIARVFGAGLATDAFFVAFDTIFCTVTGNENSPLSPASGLSTPYEDGVVATNGVGFVV